MARGGLNNRVLWIIVAVVIVSGILALGYGRFSFNLGKLQLSPSIDLVEAALVKCESRISGESIPIFTCDDLKDINDNLKGSYRLINDLNCEADFEPIAFGEGDFRGVFDGQGNTIIYKYTSDTHGKIGLFSDVGECGIIKNLRVYARAKGTSSVGGVAGYVYKGILKGVRSYGTVESTGQDAGGLVGGLKSGAIIDSYSSAGVEGLDRVGGLAGAAWNFPNNEQRPIVKNSYALGQIISEGDNVGGLIGLCEYFAVSSYWDFDRFGFDNGCGTGKFGEELRRQSTFAGWDFNDVWEIEEGRYPRLRWETDFGNSQYVKVEIVRDFPEVYVDFIDISTGTLTCSDKRKGDFCILGNEKVNILNITYETIGPRSVTLSLEDSQFNKIYEYDYSGARFELPTEFELPADVLDFYVRDKYGALVELWSWKWSDGEPYLQRHQIFNPDIKHGFKMWQSWQNRISLNATLENGEIEIPIAFGDGRQFTGVGEGKTERLAVSNENTLNYIERDEEGNHYHNALVIP